MLVRSYRLIEPENPVDDRFDAMLDHKFQHRREFGWRAHGGADDSRLSEKQTHQIQAGRRIAGGGAVNDQPPARFEQGKTTGEISAAGSIDNYVHAAGQLGQLFGPVFNVIIDTSGSAKPAGLDRKSVV